MKKQEEKEKKIKVQFYLYPSDIAKLQALNFEKIPLTLFLKKSLSKYLNIDVR
jgi:hypothetical protein